MYQTLNGPHVFYYIIEIFCFCRQMKNIKMLEGSRLLESRYWWENFASRKVVEEEWRENFRMSRETFQVP